MIARDASRLNTVRKDAKLSSFSAMTVLCPTEQGAEEGRQSVRLDLPQLSPKRIVKKLSCCQSPYDSFVLFLLQGYSPSNYILVVRVPYSDTVDSFFSRRTLFLQTRLTNLSGRNHWRPAEEAVPTTMMTMAG